QAGLVQHQARERFGVGASKLAKLLPTLYNAADIALSQGNDDGVVGCANRQQALLRILEVTFQSAEFHLQLLHFAGLLRTFARILIFQLLPLEFYLLECSLGNGLIFFRSGSLELKLDQIDLGKTAAFRKLLQAVEQLAIAVGL